MDYYDINIECMKTKSKSLHQGIMEANSLNYTNRVEEIVSATGRTGIQAVVIKHRAQEHR